MKKRTSRPLLRASALMTGGALLACSSQASPPASPPTASSNASLELAETHRVTLAVSVPEGMTPTGPIRLELRVPGSTGAPLATGVFSVEGRVTTVRWDIDPSVPLPRRLHVSAVVPMADSPSPRDLIAEATDSITSAFVLLLHPRIALVHVKLDHDGPAASARPVYANTKGSHHMQDEWAPVGINSPTATPRPPPPPVTTVTVHAPEDATGFLLLNVGVLSGTTLVYRQFVAATSMPVELVLHPPDGESWPSGATVAIESDQGTSRTLTATLQVESGATATAHLKRTP